MFSEALLSNTGAVTSAGPEHTSGVFDAGMSPHPVPRVG